MRPFRPCVLSSLVTFAAVVLAPTQTSAQLGGLALPPLPDLTNPFGTGPTPAPTPKPTLKPTAAPTPKPAPAPTAATTKTPAPTRISSRTPSPTSAEESSSDDDGTGEEEAGGAGTGGESTDKAHNGTGIESRVKAPHKTFAPTPVYLVPGNGTEESSSNDETLEWAPVVYAAIGTGLAIVLLLTIGLVVRMVRNPAMASPVPDGSPSIDGSPSTGASPTTCTTVTTTATRTMRTGSRGRVSFMSPLTQAGSQTSSSQQGPPIAGAGGSSSSGFEDCVSSVGSHMSSSKGMSSTRRMVPASAVTGVLLGGAEEEDGLSRLEKAEATVVSLADDEETGGAAASTVSGGSTMSGTGRAGVTGWKWSDGSMSFTTTFRDLFRANTGEVLPPPEEQQQRPSATTSTLASVPEAQLEQPSPLFSSFHPPRGSEQPPPDTMGQTSLLMTMHLEDVVATAPEQGEKSMTINLTDSREGTGGAALLGGAGDTRGAATQSSVNLIDLTSTTERDLA